MSYREERPNVVSELPGSSQNQTQRGNYTRNMRDDSSVIGECWKRVECKWPSSGDSVVGSDLDGEGFAIDHEAIIVDCPLLNGLKLQGKKASDKDEFQKQMAQLKHEKKKIEQSRRKLLKKQMAMEVCAKKLEDETAKIEKKELELERLLEDALTQKLLNEEHGKLLEAERATFEGKRSLFMQILDEAGDYSSALQSTIGRLQDIHF